MARVWASRAIACWADASRTIVGARKRAQSSWKSIKDGGGGKGVEQDGVEDVIHTEAKDTESVCIEDRFDDNTEKEW